MIFCVIEEASDNQSYLIMLEEESDNKLYMIAIGLLYSNRMDIISSSDYDGSFINFHIYAYVIITG